jgi:hypothetical protein
MYGMERGREGVHGIYVCVKGGGEEEGEEGRSTFGVRTFRLFLF